MNQVNLVGRVVREVEVRQSSSGKTYAFASVAVDGFYDRKKGEMSSDFIDVIMWGKVAERCRNLIKGSLVSMTGRLKPSKFEKDGQTKYAMDVVIEDVRFLAKPKSN